MYTKLLSLLAVFVIASAAHSASSGLCVTPTAGTLDGGTVSLMMEQAKYDTCTLDNPTTWNLKYALARQEHKPVIALGVGKAGKGRMEQSYAVGHKRSGSYKLHLGMTPSNGALCPMLSLDSVISKKVTFMAEYTVGGENCSSLSFYFDLGKGSGITTGLTRSSSGLDGNGFFIAIGKNYTWSDLAFLKN